MLMVIIGDREVLIWCLNISLSPRTPDNHVEDGYHDGDHGSDE